MAAFASNEATIYTKYTIYTKQYFALNSLGDLALGFIKKIVVMCMFISEMAFIQTFKLFSQLRYAVCTLEWTQIEYNRKKKKKSRWKRAYSDLRFYLRFPELTLCLKVHLQFYVLL